MGLLPLHLSTLVVFLSCLITGASQSPEAFWLMLLSFFALALLIWDKSGKNKPLEISELVLLPALSVFFTAIMLLPLPQALHQILSPDTAKDLATAGSLLGQSLFPRALSISPFKTSERLMQLITALNLFIVASDTTSKTRALKWVATMSFAVFLTALGHYLVGAEKIWGLYPMGGGFFQAPLMNPNNLSRLFGVLSLLSLAGLSMRLDSSFRWNDKALLVASACISAMGAFLAQSRWGMICFAFCLIFAVKSKRIAWGILGLCAFVGLGLFVSEMQTLSNPQSYWAKLELLGQFPTLMKHHWVAGIGPGSLRFEFHKWIPADFTTTNILFTSQYVITYLENSTLQIFLDHGLFLGLALAAVAVWTFMRVWGATPELAWVLFFVWIGDFSDFALECSPVLFLCILTLALAPSKTWSLKIPSATLGLASTSLLGVLTIPYWLKQHANYLDVQYAYSQAVKNHSAEWLRYATHRRPTFYRGHLFLARLTGDFKEYQLAVSSNPGSLGELLEETKRVDLLPVKTKSGLEELLRYAFRHQNAALATLTLSKLIGNENPDDEYALWLAQTRVLQQGLEATIEETSAWSSSLEKPCPFARWRLEALRQLGKPTQALAELTQFGDCLDNPDLWKADLYTQNKEPAKAMPIIRQLLNADPEEPALKSRFDSLSTELARAIEH